MLRGAADAERAPFVLDGRQWDPPATPDARVEAARWAYRSILLREPDSLEAVEHLARQGSARAMRDALMLSPEARAQPGFPALPVMASDEPAQEIQTRVPAAEERLLFERVRNVWGALGESQPHWSVLTGEQYRPDRIESSIEAFYGTGVTNVAMIMKTLARNGIDPARLGTCMDFGCGVGRLTAALAAHFASVVAVDVSSSHLSLAREALARRGIRNVSWELLDSVGGVSALPACDLVASFIVLQHNPPPVIVALLAGLLRRIAPGGAAVIQVPTYVKGYRFGLTEYLAHDGREMELHAVPQQEVFAAAREAGVHVLEVLDDPWIGQGLGSRSNTFVFRAPAQDAGPLVARA